ncbi:MAG: hypothetical protein ACREIA_20060 [Opitutaceae bacterium]
MKRLLLCATLAALLSCAMPGCLVVTPVVKAGTGIATGAGKVVGATAGKAVGTTINTVTGGGDDDEKDEDRD